MFDFDFVCDVCVLFCCVVLVIVLCACDCSPGVVHVFVFVFWFLINGCVVCDVFCVLLIV